MNQEWINALIGGTIIGIAVSFMLLLNGRVTGISSIINNTFSAVKGDTAWRVFFILGLFLGGLFMKWFNPDVFTGALLTESWTTVIAGLLVGFGTVLGSGCTSGHGVCGISRLSLRSIVATMVFISAGIIAVVAFRAFGIFL